MTTRTKIFQLKTTFVFLPKLRWRQKKRSSLKFSPVVGPKLGEDRKKKGLHSNLVRFLAQKKVFAHPFYAQTFCSSYKGGTMPQFCIPFYANYTILATQRERPWPNGPPKYAPGFLWPNSLQVHVQSRHILIANGEEGYFCFQWKNRNLHPLAEFTD